MRWRDVRWSMVLLAVSVYACAACETSLPCQDDGHCEGDRVCAQGPTDSRDDNACRECDPADGRGCAGDDVCDPDGRCVACTDDGHCPGDAVCSAGGACVACTEDAHCAEGVCVDEACLACDPGEDRGCDGGEVCSPDARCVACFDDVHCGGGVCVDDACHPCDPADGRGCGGGEVCHPERRCVECFEDVHCGGGVCDVAGDVCAACLEDDHCPDGVCVDRACVGCRGVGDCPEAGQLCSDNACVGCADDAECEGYEGINDEPVCRVDTQRCAPCDPTRAVICDADRPLCVEPTDCGCMACGPCAADADCAGFGERSSCFEGRCVYETVLAALVDDGELRRMAADAALFEGDADFDFTTREAMTLFAPVDAAHGAIGGNCRFEIDLDRRTFVLHHILSGPQRMTAERLRALLDRNPDGFPLTVATLETVQIDSEAEPEHRITVDGRPVLRSLPALNGIVHVLGEHVLFTQALRDGGCAP